MASNQLTTTSNSGTQTTTSSPQTASGTANTAGQSSSLQPGTATSLLNTGEGVTLHSTALTTVNLSTTTATQVTPAAVPPVGRHLNAGLLSLCVVLFLMAAVTFWMTIRSAKNTTNYS